VAVKQHYYWPEMVPEIVQAKHIVLARTELVLEVVLDIDAKYDRN
tara:strand:- start:535 stop:669 length:135 start_codon:yes stop_codon:yes gene_type:complete